jgi:phosphocarrier protein HPr
MISMILLMLHAARALNEPRAQQEEDKSESMRPARPGAKKVEKEIAIVNCLGLHLRHAGRFAQMANRFRGDVWVAKDSTEVNGKSILGLITLGATQSSRLRIRIEGADAVEAMQEIERLIQSWFDEDQIENRKTDRCDMAYSDAKFNGCRDHRADAIKREARRP